MATKLKKARFNKCSAWKLRFGVFSIPLLPVILFFAGMAPTRAVASTATEITMLPTLDSLNRTESPLSNSSKWSALSWDTSKTEHNTGRDTTSGWGPYDAFSVVNGAYWNPTTFSAAEEGDAAALTMQTSPGNEKRYVAVWLNMGSPNSTKSGYQLSWTLNTGTTTYTVKLSKWSAGSQTILASNASLSIPGGTTMAISDTGETVTAWKGTGGSLSTVLSGKDSTFNSGYAGIEASGNNSRSINFKAGALPGAIASVPILDDLQRDERPLATGKWTKSTWAEEIGGAWNSIGYLGFGASFGGLYISAAYWNPVTFSDATGGTLAGATVGTGAGEKGEYVSIWLNMPNPASARSGYEARLTSEGEFSGYYSVEISKWVSGTRTVLVTKSEVLVLEGTSFALTEESGKLTFWTGTGKFSPVVSAESAAYSSGFVGLETFGGWGTIYNFKGGELI